MVFPSPEVMGSVKTLLKEERGEAGGVAGGLGEFAVEGGDLGLGGGELEGGVGLLGGEGGEGGEDGALLGNEFGLGIDERFQPLELAAHFGYFRSGRRPFQSGASLATLALRADAKGN